MDDKSRITELEGELRASRQVCAQLAAALDDTMVHVTDHVSNMMSCEAWNEASGGHSLLLESYRADIKRLKSKHQHATAALAAHAGLLELMPEQQETV